ncbi:MAG TPA: hypothetical protein VJR89_22265 [Polyangiales bacterium]|nr:hypothetical protein [Polyangiales bacterium]
MYVLALLGCSESDPTALVSGLDRDQLLFELSAAEGVRLCDATNQASMASYSPELQAEALCSVQALLFMPGFSSAAHADRAACERERDACIERGEADVADIRFCDASWRTWFTKCDATVAEYEHCMTAMLRASAEEFARRFDCATAAEGKFAQAQPLVVPECESFEARCPLRRPMPSSGMPAQ